MDGILTARIYGDSLMKGTILCEKNRYRAVMNERIRRFSERFGIAVTNRSRFGMTIDRGEGILARDLQSGATATYALIEYGGNDCNFNWAEVANDPSGEHQPAVPLERFCQTFARMVAELRGAGIRPVAMSLPPIDAEKYLRFIGESGVNTGRVLQWLGDVQAIYRFHEGYSRAICAMAQKLGVLLCDVRSALLGAGSPKELTCEDGLHLTEEGYDLAVEAISGFTAERLARG